jgi:hypothetical protein
MHHEGAVLDIRVGLLPSMDYTDVGSARFELGKQRMWRGTVRVRSSREGRCSQWEKTRSKAHRWQVKIDSFRMLS